MSSQSRFRFLLANNPLPMRVYDSETLHFLEVNDAAIRHYAYARAEFFAMRITDLQKPSHEERHTAPLRSKTAVSGRVEPAELMIRMDRARLRCRQTIIPKPPYIILNLGGRVSRRQVPRTTNDIQSTGCAAG
jgi:PAS domain-containing protein